MDLFQAYKEYSFHLTPAEVDVILNRYYVELHRHTSFKVLKSRSLLFVTSSVSLIVWARVLYPVGKFEFGQMIPQREVGMDY